MTSQCTHGITFDPGAAQEILDAAGPPHSPLEFFLGNKATAIIRERWPRGFFTTEKPCPVCGFVGIAYASYGHYLAGDW